MDYIQIDCEYSQRLPYNCKLSSTEKLPVTNLEHLSEASDSKAFVLGFGRLGLRWGRVGSVK